MSGSWPCLLPWALLLGVSGALFAAFQLNPGLDARLSMQSPDGHFYIVSAIAIVNVVLGVAAAVVALRATSTRVLLLALSFLSMSVIFAIHGLATPGFLLDMRFAGVTGFTARLGLLVATAFLAASSIEWPEQRLKRVQRYHPHLLAGWSAALIAFAVIALSSPQSLPPALLTHIGFQYASAALVLLFAGYAALRYFEGYLRSGLPMYGSREAQEAKMQREERA